MSNRDKTIAGRIRALERNIDASLMELTEVEVVINAKCNPGPSGCDEFQTRRLTLTKAIVRMDAELKQLRTSWAG